MTLTGDQGGFKKGPSTPPRFARSPSLRSVVQSGLRLVGLKPIPFIATRNSIRAFPYTSTSGVDAELLTILAVARILGDGVCANALLSGERPVIDGDAASAQV